MSAVGWWLLAVGWMGGCAAFGAEVVSPGGVEFFEQKIRPLLIEHCYECHSAEAKKVKAGLRVDTREALRRGGESGPALVPGKPEESLLIRSVRYADKEFQMPPKGMLRAEQIAALEQWVKLGAPDPRTGGATDGGPKPSPVNIVEGRKFWAFQPLRQPEPPPVKGAGWVRSPVDRFVLAALEAKGLAPAAAADRRVLLRRATFDLTGLPPLPADVERFLADDSPEAFARVVERLLASPQYGERWGRHWLDVARYSDSNGLDENLAYANAFRYRDYVIRAFNADKPYDRFLQEQLAGDLLPARAGETEQDRFDRLTATAFLSLGPKMLAEDDPRKMEMDIVDEQLDTTARAVLGLTMGCARCHDHKYDPLTQSDYYSLAGIFKSTKTMENFRVVAVWHEHPVAPVAELARAEAHEKLIKDKEAELKARMRAAQEDFLAGERKQAGRYLVAAMELLVRGGAGKAVATAGAATLKPLAVRGKNRMPVAEALVVEAEKFKRGTFLKRGPVILNAGDGGFFNEAEYEFTIPQDGNYQLDFLYASAGGRHLRLFVNGQLAKSEAANQATGGFGDEMVEWFAEGVFKLLRGRVMVRVEQTGRTPHLDKLALTPTAGAPTVELGELKPGEKTLAQVAVERRLNEDLLQRWVTFLRTANATNPVVELGRSAAIAEAEAGRRAELAQEKFDGALQSAGAGAEGATKAIRAVLLDAKGPFQLPGKPERYFPEATRKALAKLESEQKELEKKRPVLPKSLGVREGEVADLKVHLRGNYLTLGAPTRRQFPEVLVAGTPAPLPEGRSGRLELAQWLTSSDSPLTARVMANRIWQWHFGAGLVRSVDNFGRLGERPTHPELLEWLAAEFRQRGWSIKEMHRLLMLSSAYQMSTQVTEAGDAADPENRLLHHFNRRRLEAEEVRDSILMMGGKLDLTMGGQLMTFNNRAYVTGVGGAVSHASNYGHPRRSVYLPVLRSAVYEVLQAFDFGDPSVINGERGSTVVAPQALFMINSDLVAQNAAGFAGELLARSELGDAERIGVAWERAFARRPTAEETRRMLGLVERVTAEFAAGKASAEMARQQAWRSLCRVLIAANEFIYVE